MKRIIIIALIALSAWMFHRTDADIGRVVNSAGDGKLYNGEEYYNYIKYNPKHYHQDDIVLTLDFMNPFNNACDDVILRYDIRLLENC